MSLAYGFKSRHSHQLKALTELSVGAFNFYLIDNTGLEPAVQDAQKEKLHLYSFFGVCFADGVYKKRTC